MWMTYSSPSPQPAAPVGAAQGVLGHGQAHGHSLDLLAEAAHREEHAAPHLVVDDVGEDETRARDSDPRSAGGGMM